MKANELRIGNFIYPNDENGTPYPVTEIRDNAICCTNKNDDDYNWCIPEVMIGYDEIEPIPLTEDWLIKFGFAIVNGYYVLNGVSFWEEEIGDFRPSTGIGMNDFGICIQYVHQLQNLYWCLCGKELEFVH